MRLTMANLIGEILYAITIGFLHKATSKVTVPLAAKTQSATIIACCA